MPSVPVAPPRLTALEAELDALPETEVGEILFGELVIRARPVPRHARACTALVGALEPAFGRGHGGPGGWVLLVEPGLALGPHRLAPDLAGWRRETLPEIPEEKRITTPPDFVCEVLSPNTEAIDRDEKMLVYGANAVGFLWLVDVPNEAVEAYRSERGRFHQLGRFVGQAAVCIPPFDAVELPLAWLWAR